MNIGQGNNNRTLERLFLLVIACVMGFLFNNLFEVLKKDFAEVPKRLANGTMINLNDPQRGENIGRLLEHGHYFEDARDIRLISKTVAASDTEKGIDNIGELNKKKYYLDAEQAFVAGGESFQKRVQLSRILLGFTGADSGLFQSEKSRPIELPATNNLSGGPHSIRGIVTNDQGNGQGGVLVRLQMLIPSDSLYSNGVSEVDELMVESSPAVRKTFALDSTKKRQLQSFSAFARTDANGLYAFEGLKENHAYAVLPLKPGFQFGASKGTENLEDDHELNFHQSLHTIRLLSNRDFNNLKKEKALIVRTPEKATTIYWTIVAVFIAGFFLLHLTLTLRFKESDQLILPVIMLLTGFSLLTLLSLQDPLRDRFLGYNTLWHLVTGFFGLFLLLFFDMRKFTTDSGLYRMFFNYSGKGATGWPWAALATLLLVLTIILGTGPEGSGVKVNLFGFQPSEVVKFLIVIFLAGFFATNERFIAEYATFTKRWTFFRIALIAILISILLFLMLGDLGPAIVVCFTFIILFSFSRGDFTEMCGLVIVYIISNWFIENVWLSTAVTIAVVGLYLLFIRRQLSESAVMALVVISGFLLLDQIPVLDKLLPGPVQRLADRKAIWQNNWNNEVFGGDQVANGIWAMASGGITGQGIGEGYAKTIPEAHTDMILPSIGEEFGWAGLICIFILFLVYLHRSIIIGRQTGTPFLFYLAAGIGVSTFVQFILIAGGSTGVLPLSGVSLPFISYGGSSLICNFLAAGFLLSASLVRGKVTQMSYIRQQHDKNLIPALVAAVVGILLLSVNVSRYLFNNTKWVVQPALVAERSGARMFSYNPRIDILMNRLQAGSIFDRKGMLLATSQPGLIRKNMDTLSASGLNRVKLIAISQRRLDRYYPFGEHMFFWTGDANTGVFSGSPNGYFAEYKLAPELRGFNTPADNYEVMASRYREERFLPQVAREMTVVERNFGELAPLLLAGMNSKEVDSFRRQNRDVRLSVDAGLQTSLQLRLQQHDSLQNSRVSIVIMEDSTGDVLASAIWPAPPIDNFEKLTLSAREENNVSGWLSLRDLGFTYATQPGSTAKVATTLAAFNKLGDAASKRSFLIRTEDLIRVKGAEPDETGTINLERAFTRSNNPYFIRLANEEQLQENMARIYLATGMFLRNTGGYYYQYNPANTRLHEKWMEMWRNTEFKSLNRYDKNNIRATRGLGISGMSWGQGELIATPASVARLASAIANKGMLVPNRFVLQISDSVMPVKTGLMIAGDEKYTVIISDLMRKQSAGKFAELGVSVAGKTGTPERIYQGTRINDGWYVFFAPKADGMGNIVTCIRIESTRGSSTAVKLAGDLVIPELLTRGYIKRVQKENKKVSNN